MNFATPQNLLDPKFISDYFAQKITDSQYKGASWQNIKITPIKRNVGQIYHLVIRYDVDRLEQPIFCTAHSREGREHAYRALEYIDDQAFFRGKLISLTPLFYDPLYKAMFYLGISGKNLLDYVKKESDKVEGLIKLTALWLAELHTIRVDSPKHNFNPLSVHVETTVPGPEVFLKKIQADFPEKINEFEDLFKRIKGFDQANLEKNRGWLIHGDLHPENVIVNEKDESEITVIDYTDVCVADFARDLGNFLQQLEYMTSRFNPGLTQNISDLQRSFLDEYLHKRGLELDDELKKRISMYMAWTAFRSAVFFLTKKFVEVFEAEKLIKRVPKYIEAADNNALIF